MTLNKMREYFEKKGVSQLEVGRFIGVQSRTIRSWFSGDIEPPQLFIMAIEADIFDVEERPEERVKKRLVLKKLSDMQEKIDTLYNMYTMVSGQLETLMDQQRAQIAAMRGRLQ